MHENTTIAYHCAPHTRWAVEACGIVLIHLKTGIVCRLTSPQAAVWDLLTRSYSYDHIVCMLTAITSLQADDVEKLIAESLKNWVDAGLLVRGNL
jgi:hypothetical protein